MVHNKCIQIGNKVILMSYFPYFDASHDYAFHLSLAIRLHVQDSLEANNFNTFES